MLPVRRRRILHLIDSGGIYGAERVILALSEAMRRDGEFEPIVGCIVDDTRDDRHLAREGRRQGVQTAAIRIRNTWAPLDLLEAARTVRDMGVDLIHSHGYKPSVFGYVIGRLAGVPVMATCHLWYLDSKAPLKMRVMIALEKRLYRFFPAVVAVSDRIRDVLLASGVPADRVHVIRNGIEIPEIHRSRSHDSVAIGDPGEGRAVLRVLNVGRLTEQKAQSGLLRAAALLRRRGLRFRVAIVGDGELRGALSRQIRADHLEGVVDMPGFCDDMAAVLAQADVFVLPSLDEGLPISLLEAMAAGVPAIATPVGDVPKLIDHGVTGLLVRPGDVDELADAIERLLTDPGLRTKIGRAGRERVRQSYSQNQMFAQYRKLYVALP